MFNFLMTSPRKRSDAAQSPQPPIHAHEPFYKTLLEYMELLQRLTGASFSMVASTAFVSTILEIRRDIDIAVAAPNRQPFRVYKLAELLILIDGHNVLDNTRDVVAYIYNHIINDLFCPEQCHFDYQLSCELFVTFLRDRFPPWQSPGQENAAKLVWRLLFGLDGKSGATLLKEQQEICSLLQKQEWFQYYLPLPHEMQAFCNNVLSRPWIFKLITPMQLNAMFSPPPDSQWDSETITMHGERIVKCLMNNLNYSQDLLNETAIERSSVIQLFLKYPQLIEALNCKALASLFVLADAQESFRASTAFSFMLRQFTRCIIKGDMDNITAVPYILYEMTVYGYLYSPEMPFTRRQAFFTIFSAKDLLETLQFLDPNDNNHTRPEQFIFVESDDRKPTKALHKAASDFDKINALLLSDEMLALRQNWIKQEPYQSLFCQYPQLIKGVSMDDVVALPQDALKVIAIRAMHYRKIYNIFHSYFSLLAYLDVENIVTLYYQDVSIKARIDEVKLSKDVILSLIENSLIDVLIERIPTFAQYLHKNYLSEILLMHAARRLLLAFLSNKCTQLAFMRFPSLLQFFAAQDLCDVVTASSFLRQCVKQRDLIEWMKQNQDVLRQPAILDGLLSSLYKSDESVAIVKLFYPDNLHPASKLCLSHLNYDISLEMIATCVRAFPVRSRQLVASQGLTPSEKKSLLPIFERLLIPYGSLQILEVYLSCLKQALNGEETISALLPSYFIAAQVLFMYEPVSAQQAIAVNKSVTTAKMTQWATLAVDLSKLVEQLVITYPNKSKSDLAYLLLDTCYRSIIRIENISGINVELLCAIRKRKAPLLTLIESMFGAERKQKLIASTTAIAADQHKQITEQPKYEEAREATADHKILQKELVTELEEVFETVSKSDGHFKVEELVLPKAFYKPKVRQRSNATHVSHSLSTHNLRDLVKDGLSSARSKDKAKSKKKGDKHKIVKDKKPKTVSEMAASSSASNQAASSETVDAKRAKILEKWAAQKARIEAMKQEKQKSQAQQINSAAQITQSNSVAELPSTNTTFKRERRNTITGSSLTAIDVDYKAAQEQLRKEIDEREEKLRKYKSLSSSAAALRTESADAKKIQAREQRLKELEQAFSSQSQLHVQQSTSDKQLTTRMRRNTMSEISAAPIEKSKDRVTSEPQSSVSANEVSTTDVINHVVASHVNQTTTSYDTAGAATITRQRRYSVSESSSSFFFAASRPVNSGLSEVKGAFGRIQVKSTGAQESVKDMAKRHTEERRRRASFSETRKTFGQ